jgi:hypothetical protein
MNVTPLILAVAVTLLGCASPNRLPSSVAEVDFSALGFVEGSGWHDGAVFQASEDEIVSAIRSALVTNGLRINEFSKNDRRFRAESPLTWTRWDSYIGVYYRPVSEHRYEVHVVAIGTKDVNVIADDPEPPIPPRVIASIYSALSRR